MQLHGRHGNDMVGSVIIPFGNNGHAQWMLNGVNVQLLAIATEIEKETETEETRTETTGKRTDTKVPTLKDGRTERRLLSERTVITCRIQTTEATEQNGKSEASPRDHA